MPEQQRDAHGRLIYEPDGACLAAYVTDRSEVCVIRGPIGSGKSLASCVRIWLHANEQRRGPDGVRRSRWAVVRNTYPDLKGSTVRTWLDLFPEELYGRFLWSIPMRHVIRAGDVELEVDFLALDKPEDVRKLRSTEYTGVWFNELQYIPKELFDEAHSRTGRFPAVKDGGCTWSGVIADMNEPGEDHFVPLMTGEVAPPEHWTPEELAQMRWPRGWRYLPQPAGLLEVLGADGKTVVGYRPNPKAENLKWLKGGRDYYRKLIEGKSRAWIDSRVMNRISVFVDGRAVWPSFRVETHVAKTELRPVPGWPVYVGLDFGRQPAAVFGQLINNRWVVLYELQAFDVGSTVFAPMVKRAMTTLFPGSGWVFNVFGDPKGRDKPQSHEQTAYDVFGTFGIVVRPAPVPMNNVKTRLEAVEFVLNGLHDGMPRFLLSPACRTLKVGMQGKYHYRRIKGTSGYAEEPEKDRYSHVADALQYMILGGGEGRTMVGRSTGETPRAVNGRTARRSLRRGAHACRPSFGAHRTVARGVPPAVGQPRRAAAGGRDLSPRLGARLVGGGALLGGGRPAPARHHGAGAAGRRGCAALHGPGVGAGPVHGGEPARGGGRRPAARRVVRADGGAARRAALGCVAARCPAARLPAQRREGGFR